MMTGEMGGVRVKVLMKPGSKPSIRNAETGKFMKFQGPLSVHMTKSVVGYLSSANLRRWRKDWLAIESLVKKKSVHAD